MNNYSRIKNKKITIILIAHRLTSVKNCDTIFQVEQGRIKKRGSFDEICS